MIFRLGQYFSRLSQRYLPEPFIFALFLTFAAVTFAICGQWQLGKSWRGVSDLLIFWQKTGLWQYLEFGMQMVLVLLTGHAVATAPPVLRFLKRLASWPQSPVSAIIMTAALSIAAGLIHWGLALIVGAYFAKEVGQRFRESGKLLHYPLCGAAAYLGLMVWHGGMSGSAPLVMNTPGHFLSEQVALIPVSETLFSPLNMLLTFGFFVGLPLAIAALHPRREEDIVIAPLLPVKGIQASVEGLSWVERLESSPLWFILFVSLGMASFYVAGWERFHLSLNSLNLIFLLLGFALHKNPKAYLNAVHEGIRSVSGVVLLFPLYAGIYGLLAYDDVIRQVILQLVSEANETLFVVGTFLSAGILNLFVPSGGGQWGIQGPLAIAGAEQLGIPLGKITMAVAYGDEWTNMLQPFWAIPILQITGLKARDIIGYTALIMLLALPVYLVALLAF